MNRYELNGELGDGSFGRVMKATHKETGEVVAIKHIKRKFKTWTACVGLREVQSLRQLNHPNIVPIREVIRERNDSLYFVFEYMPDGSLYELTMDCHERKKAGKPTRLTEKMIQSFIKQILSGLTYIHRNGYVHRDIKPENLLVGHLERGVRGATCKIADFGLAREVTRGPITFYVSTRWYRAPEVILHCPYYGKPIDLFATGLILAELHSLRPLFPGTSEVDQLNKMMKLLGPPVEKNWSDGVNKMTRMGLRLSETLPREHKDIELAIMKTLPRDTSPLVARLVRELIEWNPQDRPSADVLLSKHEYLRENEAGSETKPKESRTSEGANNQQKEVGNQQSFKWKPKLESETQTQHNQQPNEFSQYLDAYTKPAVVTRQPNYAPSVGRRIRPNLTEQDVVEVQPRPHRQQFLSGISTPSGRRALVAQSTNKFNFNGTKSVRKTNRKKSKGSNRFNQHHYSRANLGRRSMEVSISRPEPNSEGFNIVTQQQQELVSKPPPDDPFTCLE